MATAKKTPAKKAYPSPPVKKAPAKTAVAKKAPAPKKQAPSPREAREKKPTAKETLVETAADRGWLMTQSKGDDSWDIVFSKPNPVLGGFERLKVKFDGNGLGEVSHENLNQEVPFEGGLDDAVQVLTGEPA